MIGGGLRPSPPSSFGIETREKLIITHNKLLTTLIYQDYGYSYITELQLGWGIPRSWSWKLRGGGVYSQPSGLEAMGG